MPRAVALVACVAVVTIAVGDEKARDVTFGKADVGKVPSGWTVARTGEGEGSQWEVAADDTAPSKSGFALTQLASGPTRLFNLCVLEGSSFRDGEVAVQFKSVKGEIDQGGGVLWRYKDANNYYVCRYNPLEENFRVYHVKNGKRTQLQTKENATLPAGKWFALSVKQVGNKIECSLDGKSLLMVTDDTFPEAGKVGLWTKADAVTSFDKLSIAPAGK